MRTHDLAQQPLAILRSLLLNRGFTVQTRGEFEAIFLFVNAHERVIEASSTKTGQVWVEFWGEATEDDSPPDAESYFDDVHEASESIVKWLGGF